MIHLQTKAHALDSRIFSFFVMELYRYTEIDGQSDGIIA